MNTEKARFPPPPVSGITCWEDSHVTVYLEALYSIDLFVYPNASYFDYCSFVVSFELKKNLPTLFFFNFNYSGSLEIP